MTQAIKDMQLSLRVPSGLKDRIDTYAQLTGRSKSHVVLEGVADYLDWRTPQIADLKAAIAAADRGEFASDAQVQSIFDRWGGELVTGATANGQAASPRRARAAKQRA